MKEYYFVLIRNVERYKKGKKFNSFNGIVKGIVIKLKNGKLKSIDFNNKYYFRLIIIDK